MAVLETGLRGRRARRGGKRLGQVVVEMILILPVFFMMLFMIMECGNLAFQTIVVHHAAYEAARIGSLVAGCDPGTSSLGCGVDIGRARARMRQMLCEGDANNKKFFSNCNDLTLQASEVKTMYDRQAQRTHSDIEVELAFKARLIFPMTSILLADPKGSGKRLIRASVRMPIESPVFR